MVPPFLKSLKNRLRGSTLLSSSGFYLCDVKVYFKDDLLPTAPVNGCNQHQPKGSKDLGKPLTSDFQKPERLVLGLSSRVLSFFSDRYTVQTCYLKGQD